MNTTRGHMLGIPTPTYDLIRHLALIENSTKTMGFYAKSMFPNYNIQYTYPCFYKKNRSNCFGFNF